MKEVGLTILFSVVYMNFLLAQELTPPIQNFSSVQYGAASQNWDVAIDERGVVYAANNEGLLSYDGQAWELFPLRTGSIIRSVYPHNDRIYIGSYQEFGYWSRDNKGNMIYKSLIPLLKEHVMRNEEIWDILSFNGSIYFRSFGAVYKYDHEKIVLLKDEITSGMVEFNERLLFAVDQKGVFALNEKEELIPLPNQELLIGEKIKDIEGDGENLLIGTRYGLYIHNGEEVKLFPDNILNELISRYELNHILRISENEIVIATVKNGLIHYRKDTGDIKIYNRNSGLQNNTVLSIINKNGKIWVGLDNGIDLINLDSPVNFYTDDTGELGAVYDLTFHNSKLYVGSNTGVYELSKEGLELIEGAEGHCWNLEVLDGGLYSNHNTGTYRIINNKFVPVEGRTGSFSITKPPGQEEILLIGNYTGVSGYSPQSNEIFVLDHIKFPVKKIIYENRHTVWATHPYEGVYRIGLSEDLRESTSIDRMDEFQGRENYKADVFKLNNSIALYKDNTWFKYNPFSDSLEAFEELEAYSNHRLLLEDRNGFWFTNSISNSIIFTDFKDTKLTLTFEELNKRIVKGNEKVISANDSIYYITLNDGFGRINLAELKRVRSLENLTKPIIYNITDSEKPYDLTQLPKIPFKNARVVSIRVGLPDSDAKRLLYRLEGRNIAEGQVKDGVINFQNLDFGDYALKVFAIGPQENSTEIALLEFEVLPPWYLSTFMSFIYFLIFLSLAFLLYWINRRKLKKHQLMLEKKYEEEHEERLNRLEKERLMEEINSKRKELANTTLIGARKNEVLMEIQGELNKDKDKFSNQFRLKHIMNKINSAIKSKDEWKVFETNFNEVHEDFFKELLKRYPQLSNKDLKLCSYLKMNLSSKEIAPLMGISVRGVEVHRYRLRKKIDLDSKENLNNFLIKNF